MKKTILLLDFLVFMLAFTSCSSFAGNEIDDMDRQRINIAVGNKSFTAIMDSNEAVNAFIAMLEEAPISIDMRDYGGFEKVGYLGKSLPSSDRQITTTSGDIVLYNSNQIVVFYGTNSWSYTQLGRVEDVGSWREALGSGDVTIVFSVDR